MRVSATSVDRTIIAFFLLKMTENNKNNNGGLSGLLITGQVKKINRDGPLKCATESSGEIINNSLEGAKISEGR